MWIENISGCLDIWDLSIDELSEINLDSMDLEETEKKELKRKIEKRIILLSNSSFISSNDIRSEIRITQNLVDILSNEQNFKIESSGLIVDLHDNKCKCYCWGDKSIPIVCWRGESCNNFDNADKSLHKINKKTQEDNISDLY